MGHLGKNYSRLATVNQQKRRPRKSSSCSYDASKEISITRDELLRARALVIGRRISLTQAKLENPTESQIAEIYRQSDQRQEKRLENNPIKPNSFLDQLLEKVKVVYYAPGRYREIFQLRKKRGVTKTNRLPRGERLEVMTVISMYLTLTINFAFDGKCLAKYTDPENSPTVKDMVDVLYYFLKFF